MPSAFVVRSIIISTLLFRSPLFHDIALPLSRRNLMKLMLIVRTVVLFGLTLLSACVSSPGDEAVFMPDGLVAYYRLNGDAVDKSGNGHDGTVVGAVAVADRNGNDNSALSFNGVNSYVRCGDILDDVFCAPVAKFSIAAWAKTRTIGRFASGGGLMLGKSRGGHEWSVPVDHNSRRWSDLCRSDVRPHCAKLHRSFESDVGRSMVSFCARVRWESGQI